MLNIKDYIDKFKPARNISYYAFVCKIPVGSVVIDKIRNSKVFDLVGQKQVLTPLEVREISMKNANFFSYSGVVLLQTLSLLSILQGT